MSTRCSRRAQLENKSAENKLSGELLNLLISEFVDQRTRETSVLNNLQADEISKNNIQNYVNLCAKKNASEEEVMALARNYVTGYLKLRTTNVNSNFL